MIPSAKHFLSKHGGLSPWRTAERGNPRTGEAKTDSGQPKEQLETSSQKPRLLRKCTTQACAYFTCNPIQTCAHRHTQMKERGGKERKDGEEGEDGEEGVGEERGGE